MLDIYFRNGHGAVNCNTMYAGFNGDLKYGGTDGRGSYGCPNGFVGVGHLCFKFPVQDPALYTDMVDNCKSLEAIPYAPFNLVQNVVVKGLAKMTVIYKYSNL